MLDNIIGKLNKKIQRINPNINLALKDDCALITGATDSWDEIVAIGRMVAKTKKFYSVINNIKLNNFVEPEMTKSKIVDKAYDGLAVDVLVVGGGVVGAAIIRELTKYKLKVALVEKEEDLALHASSRNDGCIHVGVDLSSKTKKLKYLRRSVLGYEKLAQDLDVDYEKMGQIVAFKSNWLRLLYPFLKLKIKKNGIQETKFLNHQELFAREPNLNKAAKFGIFFGTGASICPYNMTIALAESAVINGAKVFLSTAVLSMDVKNEEIVSVETNRGTIFPKVVINAAGVFSDVVAEMAGDKFFSIHPRKGTNAILDKKSKSGLMFQSTTIYDGFKKASKNYTKGGGIIPTVDGNILVGPTAVETPYREDFTTSCEEINQVFGKHQKNAPNLSQRDVITYFSGIRAATYEEDFIIQKGKWTKNIVHAAGIQSPGLTAAPAIAEDVAQYASEIIGNVMQNTDFNPYLKGITKVNKLSLEERNKLILSNPDYGQIVCRCEEISKGEIIDALRRPIAVPSIDAIKKRTRAGMGRCQGGFCQPLVIEIIAQEMGISLEDINKKGEGKILLHQTKGETHE
ncbi:MAG TPA: FAD-dependent oxidoreductase [Bacilli bacterium]|nr:FAD-dependent oxidoreductase [Bacilli bacterium]